MIHEKTKSGKSYHKSTSQIIAGSVLTSDPWCLPFHAGCLEMAILMVLYLVSPKIMCLRCISEIPDGSLGCLASPLNISFVLLYDSCDLCDHAWDVALAFMNVKVNECMVMDSRGQRDPISVHYGTFHHDMIAPVWESNICALVKKSVFIQPLAHGMPCAISSGEVFSFEIEHDSCSCILNQTRCIWNLHLSKLCTDVFCLFLIT